MVLIDTSCWMHALRRRGDEAIRGRVRTLLDAEEAAWCEMVRLELWHGVANDWDKKLLEWLEGNVKLLAINTNVWQRAVFLGSQARGKGLNVPVAGLLIFACGSVHGVPIEHADRHYELLHQAFPE